MLTKDQLTQELVLGRMVEHSNIRSLSNFQQMFCFTKPS